MKKNVLLVITAVLVLAACSPSTQVETIAQTQTAVSIIQTKIAIDQIILERTQEALSNDLQGVQGGDNTPPTPVPDPSSPSSAMDFAISQVRHFRGEPDAPIVILEFSDFQ